MGRDLWIPPVVSAVGLAVLVVGFGLGYEPITTIIPGTNSMKPVTATMFAVSGLILPLVYRKRGVMTGSALTWLLLYMGLLGMAGWSGVAHAFGLTSWFPALDAGPPSIGTMLAFGVVEVIALRAIFGLRPAPRLGWIMVAFGVSSTVGYIIDAPRLYFAFHDFDAMAVHTGLCFIALGIAHLSTPRVQR